MATSTGRAGRSQVSMTVTLAALSRSRIWADASALVRIRPSGRRDRIEVMVRSISSG